jgi:hypothetical protein
VRLRVAFFGVPLKCAGNCVIRQSVQNGQFLEKPDVRSALIADIGANGYKRTPQVYLDHRQSGEDYKLNFIRNFCYKATPAHIW